MTGEDLKRNPNQWDLYRYCTVYSVQSFYKNRHNCYCIFSNCFVYWSDILVCVQYGVVGNVHCAGVPTLE